MAFIKVKITELGEYNPKTKILNYKGSVNLGRLTKDIEGYINDVSLINGEYIILQDFYKLDNSDKLISVKKDQNINEIMNNYVITSNYLNIKITTDWFHIKMNK